MKVYIQQLVAPAYRNDFFAAIQERSDYHVEVHASQNAINQPASIAADEAKFRLEFHPCRSLASGRLYWQSAMAIPKSFHKGDVLVFNSNPRILSNFVLLLSAKLRGCKIVSWNHFMSSSSGALSSRIRKAMTKLVSDHYFVYVQGEANQMESLGYDRSRITALGNTINTANVREACHCWSSGDQASLPNNDLVQALRQRKSERLRKFAEDNSLADSFNLLFCGRITKKTRLNILLEGFASFRTSAARKTKLIIIGDGEEQAYGRQLAKKLDIESAVLWVGAVFDEVDLAPWFLNADLFVYPGAIGLSLNHAMAYGLPVVTHDNPANQMPEFFYLKEGENGFLFQEENADSLTKKLLEAMGHDQLEVVSSNASRQIMEKYTFDNMVNNFISGLSSLENQS